MLRDPDATEGPSADTLRAVDSPASMARLRATFVDSHDGWVDDNIAFANDWGFALGSIGVPVSIWSGSRDVRSRKQAAWLAAAIEVRGVPRVRRRAPADAPAYRRMLAWLRA